MATPTSEDALNHITPSVLTDNAGSTIVPTVVPPVTGFEDYRDHADVSERLERKPADTTASYFDQDHASRQPVDPTTTTEDHATPNSPLPERTATAKPTKTQPGVERAWQPERPRPEPRRSTLLNSAKRHFYAARPTQNKRASYFFQPYSESSRSSSSSEDEEPSRKQTETGPKKGKRKSKDEQKENQYSGFAVGNENFKAEGRTSRKDGRLNISINEAANSGYIAKVLGQGLRHHLGIPSRHGHGQIPEEGAVNSAGNPGTVQQYTRSQEDDAESIASHIHTTVKRPRLNIVIMIIGSRGDIQPFMKIGNELKNYGHRVRIATHPAFRDFVESEIGLEFFSIGGNPSELMAFMVKNPGLIPNLETVRQGEIQRRRNSMAEMFEGFWRACVHATDDPNDKTNTKLSGSKGPFVADAIIANPPSFCHVHIAERLGIPLHMMFTFPYSPTQSFPHPLANIKPQKSNVDESYINFMSFPLVEMMTWQGLGDLVNRFRVKTLGLEPVSSLWAPGALYRMKVPYTYLWSPKLVPKPKDWGPEIDIAGFTFLDLASNFEPPQELVEFLDAGEPPVYIGFGSIVVDDPDKFTKMIFSAVKMAGVRALVSKGWGGLGDKDNTPDNIFMLENTPHDWLFPRVKAVVHHGGAGTTAIGLKCGIPTMIVPFFGDQPFWGAMVANARAGAFECIPYKRLTAGKLAEGIKQCSTEEARTNVKKIAESIEKEGDGAENAVKSFHRSLPLAGRQNMRCSILEERVAVWQLKGSALRLSPLAAEILIEEKKIRWHDLRLIRHHEWDDFDGPGEPISGAGATLLHTSAGVAKGVGMVPVKMAKHIKKREEHERRKKDIQRKKEERRRMKGATSQQEVACEDKAMPNAAGQNQAASSTRPGVGHQDTSTTVASTALSADPSETLAHELAEDAGHGLLESGAALVSAPLDLGLAVAQGFHNAPRLYGDATVRKPVRITGFHSGMKAAKKEFVYGIYDGWTGLVTQPVGGWRDAVTMPQKFMGLGRGFGKGVGGFVLKDVSAIIYPPAAISQGVRKEVQKRIGGPSTDQFIRKANIIRGQKDRSQLSTDSPDSDETIDEVKERVLTAWRIMNEIWAAADAHRTSGRGGMGRLSLHREKKSWVRNGALENVSTAEEALQARKEGKSLDKVFKRRRAEMKKAEQPRAPAMENSTTYEEEDEMVPNGHVVRDKHANRDDEGDETTSDETCVETPERDARDGYASGSMNQKLQQASDKLDDQGIGGHYAKGETGRDGISV